MSKQQLQPQQLFITW